MEVKVIVWLVTFKLAKSILYASQAPVSNTESHNKMFSV